MYDHILIPTDGSAVAEAAVNQALDIADRYDAVVHALYVAETDVLSHGLDADEIERLRRGQFDGMDELRENAWKATGYVRDRGQVRGLTVKQHHIGGKPHREIADYANREDVDLVVMGSHGRAGVQRALVGSVTERTLRSTHAPVLVVDYHGVEGVDAPHD